MFANSLRDFSLVYAGLIHKKKDHFQGANACLPEDGVILERANAKVIPGRRCHELPGW